MTLRTTLSLSMDVHLQVLGDIVNKLLYSLHDENWAASHSRAVALVTFSLFTNGSCV